MRIAFVVMAQGYDVVGEMHAHKQKERMGRDKISQMV